MWILKTSGSGTEYTLACNRDIVIGRKDTDIVIAGDSSISRRHAILRVTFDSSNLKYPDAVPDLTLTDTSKFGTFITKSDGEKKKVQEVTAVQSGDIVLLGGHETFLEIRYVPLVISTSMLANDVKVKLQKSLLQIGGHFVSNWHDKVTHLVVENIKLSVKMTLALVNACHIVTPDYIYDLEAALGSPSKLTEPERFMPVLAEPNLSQELCSFKADIRRKEVFKDKLFIHISKKQQNRLGLTITNGGGRSVLAKDSIIDENVLSNSDTAVVAFNEAERKHCVLSEAEYVNLQETLIKIGHRLIAEHEIGLAVLYCDSTVYGNPTFDLNSQNAFTQQQNAGEPSSEGHRETIRVIEEAATQEPSPKPLLNFSDASREVGRSSKDHGSSKGHGLSPKPQARNEPSSPEKTANDPGVFRGQQKRSQTPESLGASNDSSSSSRLEEQPPPKKTKRFHSPGSHGSKDPESAMPNLLSRSEISPSPEVTTEDARGQGLRVSSDTGSHSDQLSSHVVEDIPDSCLDDDRLWSQNFNSMSYRRRERSKEILTKSETIEENSGEKMNPFVDLSKEDEHITDILVTKKSKKSEVGKGESEIRSSHIRRVVKEELPSPDQENEVSRKSSEHVPIQCRLNEDIHHDPSLPKSLAKVELCNLLSKRKQRQHVDRLSNDSGVKNFKRFVKVWPTYLAENMPSGGNVSSAPMLPQIIGGSDFFVNVPQKDKNITDWFGEKPRKRDPFSDMLKF